MFRHKVPLRLSSLNVFLPSADRQSGGARVIMLNFVQDEAADQHYSLAFQAASEGFQYEHRIRHRDGSWRWVVARGLADRGRDMAGGALADHTERRTCDPLTGLPNRLSFLERLERRLREAHGQKVWNFAVVSVNLERYRLVSESMG